MNMLALPLLISVEFLHERVLVVPWLENAVADNPIDRIPKKRKVGLGTQCLLDHHTFRVHNEPIGTDIWIAQYLTQRLDPFAKSLEAIQYLSRRENGFEEGACSKPQCATLQIHNAAGVPLEGIGHAQQAHRFASWGSID